MARLRSAVVVLGSVLVLGGCGAGQQDAGGGTPTPAPPATTTTTTTTTSADDAPVSDPATPTPVPEQLRFTAKTVDGEDFSGESLAGKPAVLWFWAPWCPNCQAEAPAIADAARSAGDVAFVGVAAQDEVAAMRDFVQRYDLGSFPHIADTDAAVWQRFDVTYQPAYAFIGSDGTVETVTSQLEPEELAARVGALS
ncbi:redoxin domain-containing protein [Actinophytocola algeriensis]|uniref:Thiol-disulfide isomerase/thioredoxin n=1 Tax=Actinophytocola algeriensis TaxID=1768010 RepID=A0A7W7VGF4_9PSEU|nr:redoxin domain-containing protein [Actinophytocola algeriensis]MBB4909301.1 thiol-disulfide isomerase/thioredoxin [Actinophytocola algeriensis]MBE1475291.1 thiol-disulfide isomerase/thioredoxin [Actinophytocola algeriensis]